MVKEQIPCSPPGGDDPAEDLRLEAVRREASAWLVLGRAFLKEEEGR